MALPTDDRVNELVASISKLNKFSFSSDLDRRLALIQVQKLVMGLQTSNEVTTGMLQTNTFVIAAFRALLSLNLFEKWDKEGGHPKTSEQLAQLTGCQVVLLGLLSTHGKDSDGKDIYIFTEFAKDTASGKLGHFWFYHNSVLAHCMSILPKYLTKIGFHEPTNYEESPWASCMGMPFMEHMQSNPEIFTHLNEVLAIKSEDSIPWFKFYPGEHLISNTQGPVIVDIGGGKGHDIKLFHEHFGSHLASGQLILQDVPQAIEEAGELPPTIHKQVHDFFTEQPIKGARIYFLHRVLHDWPAQECHKILAHIKEAMKPGYSRLLINESVLSLDSSPLVCSTDMAMMVLGSGAERTEKQWREMLTAVGMRVINICASPAVDEAIVEAEI